MKYKKIITLFLTLAVAASALTGCGSQSASNNSGNSAGSDPSAAGAQTEDVAFDAEENTIRVATQPGQIRTAINILADQLGYYKEEGVNVEFVNAAGTEALTAITTGKDLDVLGTGIVPDLTFIANGSDLVVFEGTAAEGGAIISKPENVDTYKELTNYSGITAAMVRGESSWTVIRTQLKDAGVDLDSITLMEVDSTANVAQAVAKGEADVGFLPVESANSFLDIGVSIVYEVGELEPQYVCCRQVTSSEKLSEKRDAFVKYSIANLRAWEYYSDESNREEIVRILAEVSGKDEDYVNNYLFVNRTILTLDPNQKGVISYYDSLSDSGYFDGSTVDVAEHIDTSVYSEALNALLEREPDDAFYQSKLELFQQYNET